MHPSLRTHLDLLPGPEHARNPRYSMLVSIAHLRGGYAASQAHAWLCAHVVMSGTGQRYELMRPFPGGAIATPPVRSLGENTVLDLFADGSALARQTHSPFHDGVVLPYPLAVRPPHTFAGWLRRASGMDQALLSDLRRLEPAWKNQPEHAATWPAKASPHCVEQGLYVAKGATGPVVFPRWRPHLIVSPALCSSLRKWMEPLGTLAQTLTPVPQGGRGCAKLVLAPGCFEMGCPEDLRVLLGFEADGKEIYSLHARACDLVGKGGIGELPPLNAARHVRPPKPNAHNSFTIRTWAEKTSAHDLLAHRARMESLSCLFSPCEDSDGY